MRRLLAPTGPRPFLIGVVHLGALPGAPRASEGLPALLDRARADARAFATGGADALLVENFGDVPFFPDCVPPETVAAMALAAAAVHEAAPALPLGVNVLRNDARAALALCATTAATFLRVNVHVGAMVTDQGLVQGCAADTLRTRTSLCPDAVLLADVHVKHASPLGRETIEEAAVDTFERGLADALVISGVATGSAPTVDDLTRVRAAVGATPLLVGSGLDEANARELLAVADGAIVGTSVKRGGDVTQPVDADRVVRLRRSLA